VDAVSLVWFFLISFFHSSFQFFIYLNFYQILITVNKLFKFLFSSRVFFRFSVSYSLFNVLGLLVLSWWIGGLFGDDVSFTGK
jgi:hypothetical protein